MKMLAGFGMALTGLITGLWAFDKAIAGHASYNLIWVAALVIAAIGVSTILVRIRHWMDS